MSWCVPSRTGGETLRLAMKQAAHRRFSFLGALGLGSASVGGEKRIEGRFRCLVGRAGGGRKSM